MHTTVRGRFVKNIRDWAYFPAVVTVLIVYPSASNCAVYYLHKGLSEIKFASKTSCC